METISSWTSYLTQGVKYIASETWQFGADATSEVANMYNEIVANTSDIVVDLATTSYLETTDVEKRNETPVEKIELETSKEKIEVFAVEGYSDKDTPAIINIDNKLAENKLDVIDNKKVNSSF